VQSIFADQPTRRFVHAFSLCGSIIKLWVFNRSGAYSLGPFNIHDKLDKFARAFVRYATIDNNTIGLNTFIKRENSYCYITLENANCKETKVRLNKAIVKQNAIICCRTACYKT